jgi:hypothetical protein
MSRPFAAAILAFSATLVPASAEAGTFSGMIGSWSGSGQVRLEGGRSEALKCRAYYTDRGAGNAIGISLRCASASNKIEMRANLTSSGGWEERQFNAAGSVSGQASANRISLAISGGGLSGSMSVTTSGSRQTVNISTAGTALKGVTVGLARD